MQTLIVSLMLIAASVAAPAACPGTSGVAVQVLGSGGPIADDGRASSAYLVWVDGESRVMIDAGGGAFLRFGEAGADFAALDFIGLSHFHADHSADFPALLKSGNFSNRQRGLVVAGPAAGGPFPGLSQYLQSMLSKEHGAYGYLSGYLDGSGGLAKIEAQEVTDADEAAVAVFESEEGDLRIDALSVPHGIVPALAFRVRVDGKTIVFSSDQNGSDTAFAAFASKASLLVMHMVVPEEADGAAVKLHARPSTIGRVAAAADADRLLLSHFMARSLRDLDANVDLVAGAFSGEVLLAEDLRCVVID